jgi:hypothetical protein
MLRLDVISSAYPQKSKKKKVSGSRIYEEKGTVATEIILFRQSASLERRI